MGRIDRHKLRLVQLSAHVAHIVCRSGVNMYTTTTITPTTPPPPPLPPHHVNCARVPDIPAHHYQRGLTDTNVATLTHVRPVGEEHEPSLNTNYQKEVCYQTPRGVDLDSDVTSARCIALFRCSSGSCMQTLLLNPNRTATAAKHTRC